MVDAHRYHEISKATHTILNPLSDEHLLLIGEICGLHAGQRHLDLASGKGEMLCRYALKYGTTGVGVDTDAGYVAAANARALELGVDQAVHFVRDNAATYAAPPDSFDVVSCIGATGIGGGLAGTLDLMQSPLRGNGWLLVGDCYWIEEPPVEARQTLALDEVFADLGETLACFERAGLDLVQMVLANHDTWDRYYGRQWLNVSRWLDEHGDDPDAEAVRCTRDESRRNYLQYWRRYLGWGVFILRPLPQ